jgi:hypothetical protein
MHACSGVQNELILLARRGGECNIHILSIVLSGQMSGLIGASIGRVRLRCLLLRALAAIEAASLRVRTLRVLVSQPSAQCAFLSISVPRAVKGDVLRRVALEATTST